MVLIQMRTPSSQRDMSIKIGMTVIEIVNRENVWSELRSEESCYLGQLLNSITYLVSYFQGNLPACLLNSLICMVEKTSKFTYYSPLYYYLLSDTNNDEQYGELGKYTSFRLRVNDRVIPGPDIPFTHYHSGTIVQIHNLVAYVEWENKQHSQHRLDSYKVELIPAKILDCNERNSQEGRVKIIDPKKYRNNPIAKFNVYFALSMEKYRHCKSGVTLNVD